MLLTIILLMFASHSIVNDSVLVLCFEKPKFAQKSILHMT